jgi:hypothetical protein
MDPATMWTFKWRGFAADSQIAILRVCRIVLRVSYGMPIEVYSTAE